MSLTYKRYTSSSPTFSTDSHPFTPIHAHGGKKFHRAAAFFQKIEVYGKIRGIFGRITDLTEAPIVCVSPTDDPPLRIIARSLEDFFRLVMTIGSAGELGNLVSVRTPRQWERYWADLARERHDEETDPKHRTFFQHRRTVLHRLRTALGLEPIPDVMRYLSDLESERQAAGCIPTIDGLGVVPIEGKDERSAFDYVFPFAGSSRDHVPLDDIHAYLAAAPPAHRCAFVRDAIFWWGGDETSELWPLLQNVHVQR